MFRISLFSKINKCLKRDKIYLFLDFDGVVNTFYEEGTLAYMMKKEEDEFEFCNREVIENINVLCQKGNFEVIISSSWRYSGLEKCHEYLLKYGLDKEIKVVNTTQMKVFQSREKDIKQYLLQHHDFINFIILDDIEMKELRSHQVLINPYKGFDNEALEKAINIIR